MEKDLTKKEKEELAGMLRQGFKLALKMESCITKERQIPVVMSACAWILEKCRRVAPENAKDEFMGGLAHLMTVCGNCIEQFEKQERERHGTDE